MFFKRGFGPLLYVFCGAGRELETLRVLKPRAPMPPAVDFTGNAGFQPVESFGVVGGSFLSFGVGGFLQTCPHEVFEDLPQPLFCL